MNNLVKLSNAPTFDYNWSLIDDFTERQVAKTAVQNYAKSFYKLRDAASELIKEDTIAKARCVYQLKLTLPHGRFTDVCKSALKLNERTASALASTGKLLMDGSHKEEVLEIVKLMEPRAANKFLSCDEETKSDICVRFQESGRVPTGNDLVNRSKVDNVRRATPKTKLRKTLTQEEFDSINSRLAQAKVNAYDVLRWLIHISANGKPSPESKALIVDLFDSAQ